jgi:hypothetical protein
MSGMQKPFVNEGRKPEPPPPAPARKSGFFSRLLKFVFLVAILAALGSMAWHGKKLGEEKAIRSRPASVTAEEARANATMVPPWQWSTTDWEGWWIMVRTFGARAGASIAAQTASLKEKGSALWKDISAPKPAGATTPTTPASGGPATTPPPQGKTEAPPAAAELPAEFGRAVTLLGEGKDLWERNDLKGARPKLEEALKILDPLRKQYPAETRVEKAYELASQYLEDVNSRDF